MKEQLLQFFKKHGSIPQPDEAVIANAFQAKQYKENSYLVKEGSICNELFFVCNGVLRISGITEQGNEITYFFIAENHLCTIMQSFVNRTPSTDNILAATDADVLFINYYTLQQLYTQFPYLQNIIQHIQQTAFIEKINLRNHFLSHEDAASRYKLFVKQMPTIALRVSLTNIASYLGITPQSLSRIRRNPK